MVVVTRYLGMRSYAVLIGLVALVYALPGAVLLMEGGSSHYLLVGVVLLVASVFLFKRQVLGIWLFTVAVLCTLIWAIGEAYQYETLRFWALPSRIGLLGFLGLGLLLPSWRRRMLVSETQTASLSLFVSLLAMFCVTVFAYIELVNNLTVSPGRFDATTRSSLANAATETNWLSYGNSRRGTRYSPAEQITPSNVNQLDVAWSIRTGIGATFKNTPTQVGDRLFVCGAGNIIIAMDAASGKELWRYDAQVSKHSNSRLSYFTTTCRGVSWYEAPVDYVGECPTRILMGTTDARLLAVDAQSGKLCTTFGDKGQIDLTKNMGEVRPSFYFVTSSPAIVRGRAVVGGWVMDNQEVKEPSGVIRAFDLLTGEFSWAWDMGRPGQVGELQDDDIYTRGTPNVWSTFSVDEERGIVYAPLGNETPDYFGATRHPASEQHASSVAALNGETGELIWSFQTVHHDIWDYDVPSQPALVDIPNAEGKLEPALVQATKRGEVFMLNRETGVPIAQVTELPVPQGGVPEDWTALTQPYSALPNPLNRVITEADMFGATPFDLLWCRIEFRRMRYEGNFTPPSTQPSLQYPGNAGGYNWGAVSIDEERHIMVGNLLNTGNRTRLVPRAEMDAGAPGSPQLGTPYGMQTRMFRSPLGVPCTQPPFGMLVAIDLQNQSLLWQRSIGTGEELIGLPLEIGTPAVTGGTMITKSGLVFFAAAMDNSIRALDLLTGAEIWRHKLPQTAQSTPISYILPESSEQMIVITLPQDTTDAELPENEQLGGYVIAFKLKSSGS